MTTVDVFAPAKVNLTLHVTGQRPDGYHLIDSLVTFAPVGDTLVLAPSDVLSITVDGPEAAGVPADTGNLALRAAVAVLGSRSVALSLDKRLPVASGIGGGSADAAAAARGALTLLGEAAPDFCAASSDILRDARFRPLVDLGADVLMCLLSRPLRARGIGEKISLAALPPLPAILVNPRIPVSTPAVFRALARRENAPMPAVLPPFPDAPALIGWLAGQRNDLEAPALGIAPGIGTVLAAIAECDGCRLARMSGSGATCFGLFADPGAARTAARRILRDHPEWWITEGVLGDQSARAQPRSA